MNSVWWHEDYEWLRDQAGSVELPRWSRVELAGRDRGRLLNSLATNRLDDLRPGQGRETFLTDAKGHILAHGLVLADEQSLSLITSVPRADTIVNHLAGYVIREDVHVADRSIQTAIWYLGGSRADVALENLGLPVPQELGEHADAAPNGIAVKVGRVDIAGPAGFLLVASQQQARQVARFLGSEFKNCARAAFESARIQWGWPLDRVDIASTNFPQEVGRDARAISFNKGCYLGQETVARLDSLGHVNWRLTLLRFSSEVPATSATLSFEGKPAGNTTSMAWSPELACPVGLAYVRRNLAEPGMVLESSLGPARTLCPGWLAEVPDAR
ncbi:MAG: CAF17-like 4Fe-4S cluster assembly/insertion protein YgfZ [Thermoguttaceae bacterium]